MNPAKVILSDIVASHSFAATILVNNFDRQVFKFYLLSFILAHDVAFKTIPNSLYLQSFFSPGFLAATHTMDK